MDLVTVDDRRGPSRAMARVASSRASIGTAAALVVVGVCVQVTVGARDIDLVPVGPNSVPASYALDPSAQTGNYALRITGVSARAVQQLAVVPVAEIRDTDDVTLGPRKPAAGKTQLLDVRVVAPTGTYKLEIPGYRPFATVRAAPLR